MTAVLSKPRQSQIEMVYATTLVKDHGFTRSMIAKLGEPDRLVSNPHYRSGPASKLYAINTALAFKRRHSKQFDTTKKKRVERQAAAAKAVVTKKAKLIDVMREHPVELTCALPNSYSTLEREALSHAIERHGLDFHRPGYSGILATVRHRYTNYEMVLRLLDGKCGGVDAYELIREELDEQLDAIMVNTYGEETLGSSDE